MADHTPYQQKIIKRYYDNFDAIQAQRLAELTTELYLAEGKKRDRLWKQVEDSLTRLKFPEATNCPSYAETRSALCRAF